MARRTDLHLQAGYIRADYTRRPQLFPLQSRGGPYIIGQVASRSSLKTEFEVGVRRHCRSWSGGLGDRAHAEKTQIKAQVT